MIAFVDHDPRKLSEHALQVQIIGLIEISKAHPDTTAIAIPNAGRRSWRLGKKMKAEGMTAGAPDVAVLMPEGRVGWMETKKPKGGRQSDKQLGFEAKCKRLGHSYVLVRNLEQAITALNQWGALKPLSF